MDTQFLRAFAEVAETSSFSKAADTLHLSQPAISKRIAALEGQLGRPLFDRIGRTVRLTEAGRTLLPYAQRVLREIEDSRRALTRLSGSIAGRLSIGTSHHIGLHRLPPVLRAFVNQYADVDLDIHFMDSEEACLAVEQGRLELGIVTLPPTPLPRLEQREVWPDPMSVVVAPGHPLARQRNISVRDLAEFPALLPDERTYTHGIVRQAFHKLGLQPRVRLATNYLETLKMLVGIGLGWSALPDSMADESIKQLAVPELRLRRHLGLVWHERRSLSNAAEALMAQLLDGGRGKS
jgi:DNA-binding transcriptional LysR family regulator